MRSQEYLESLFTCAAGACSKDAQALLALRELRDAAKFSQMLIEELVIGIHEKMLAVTSQLPNRKNDLFVINGGKKND